MSWMALYDTVLHMIHTYIYIYIYIYAIYIYIYIYLRAAAPAADPGVHVREGKQLQRHKLDIIGGDMLDLFQLDEGFEESYTEVV